MKENRNLACDHIEPCNIEQSERHNRRDPEYIASLDPRTIYVRLELTHNNNVYVAPDVEGKTLQDVYEEIKVMVKQKTGRRIQERIVEITDKKGRKKKRNGSSPLRESVVRIKSNTTMDDLMRYTQKVHERWGVRATIIDFAKSGSGCRGGNHGSYFYDEESSAIKALIFKFARLAATSIEHVAQWLVWLAKELGQLTNMELHRADTEVRDIVEGKYDWRIERFENHRGDGLSV